MEWGALGMIALFGVSTWVLIVLRRILRTKSVDAPQSRTDHVELDVDLGDNVGVKSIRGARPYMEDVYQVKHDLTQSKGRGGRGRGKKGAKVTLYGVFDGHGGPRASEFASKFLPDILRDHPLLLTNPKRALITSFETLDERWLEEAGARNMDDGSTAIVALVVDDLLYLANLGDCRAVLSSEGIAIDLSHDHKPIRQDEKERIENLGGRIIFHGTWRVQGALAVTRAFGDKKYKKYITATPEVSVRQLREGDEFLVLASDGVWDVMSSQDSVDTVHESVEGQSAGYHHKGAQEITNLAYQNGSMDNITTLLVDLAPHVPE